MVAKSRLNVKEQRPVMMLIFMVIATGIMVSVMTAQDWNSYQIVQRIRDHDVRIENLRGIITHLDEVLTMSARMAAATGDLKWEKRYHNFEPKLDAAIKEVIRLSPHAYEGEAASETDAANIKLVEMEHKSFELVKQGNREEAKRVLFSADYEAQKNVYADGMKKLNVFLEQEIESNLDSQKKHMMSILTILGGVFAVWFLIWLRLFKLLFDWGIALIENRNQLSRQAEELSSLNQSLDKKVLERTRELERANEAAQAASKAKSDFLATMSHEIRTPMNAILGMADLLAEGELPEEQKEYVDILRRNGNHLLTIINDVLDLSKIEVGKLELESIPFDLPEVVERVTEMMVVRAHQKGLELIYRIDSNVPRVLEGDGNRLRQILTNLIGNAVKFTEKGEILLEISLPRERKNPQAADMMEIQFTVRDTGIGIPADKREEIFAAFTQVDSSTTRRFGGTGLGLNICKKMVELMGGKIWVESEPGKGSKFYFTGYFKNAAQKDIPRFAPVKETGPLDLRDQRILIVDDNATNRLILREMLKSTGATVNEAEDGMSGLEMLRMAKKQNPFGLILLDCRMPGMDGFEFVREVQKDPELKGIAIMMLTSDDRRGHAERARQLGMSMYLIKPIKKDELFNAIRSAMARKPMPMKAVSYENDEALSIPKDKNQKMMEGNGVKQETSSDVFKVLLVEDNPDNQLLIQSYLKKTSYQLEIASNGLEAFEKIQQSRFDVVLMDLHMPVMDGYAATRKIREWEKQQNGSHRPAVILALSASALQSEVNKSIEAGCDEHLSKPIKKELLLNVLRRYDEQFHPGKLERQRAA